MKVHIERDWATQAVKVWLFTPIHTGAVRYLRLVGPDAWEEVEVANGEQAPDPTFTMHEMFLKALVDEASGAMPADRAMEVALKDTKDMRDRLLSMVEVAFKPTVTGPQ